MEPKYTITAAAFNNMVEKLCGEIAILEHVVDYAMCIDNDLEWKFKENWRKHPEILEAFEKWLERQK